MLYTIAAVASLLQIAAAQTPFGFSPALNRTLGVSFGNVTVSPAGKLLPRAEVLTAPTITSTTFSNTTNALLLMVDLDVPSNTTRTKLLHWFVPSIPKPATNTSALQLSTTLGAPYLTPNPPVGDSPHRYVFLLYSQPANFTVPAAFAKINPPANQTARTNFDLDGFVAQARLGTPIAANYMTVQNLTAATNGTSGASSSTTTFPAASATGAAGVAGASSTTSAVAKATGGANVNSIAGSSSGFALVVAAGWLFGLV